MIPRLRLYACIAAVASLAGARAVAQRPPDTRVDILVRNDLKLAGTLEMDRPVYLAGETMNLTVTISNPTATPLEVLKPFDDQTGWFVGLVRRVDQDGDIEWRSGQTDLVHRIPEDAPSVVLQPGQSITHQYHFYDEFPGTLHIVTPFTASTSPATRRLQYAYGNWAFAEYQVVMPVLEEFVVVRLPKEEGASEPADTYVFSLASGGQHFLCVRRQPISHSYNNRDDLRLRPDGVLTEGDAHALSPYSRFAPSDMPFTSLTAAADAGSNLTITWTSPDPSAPGGTKHSTLTLQKADWLVELPDLPEDPDDDSN